MINITYQAAQLRELRVLTQRKDAESPEKPVAVEFRGERVLPTARFWHSLFHRFGIAPRIFKYFDYHEVLHRVVQRNANDHLRLCLERDGGDALPESRRQPRLLAVSNPRRPVLDHDSARGMVSRHEGQDVHYHEGLLRSAHVPRSGEHAFHIGQDLFRNRFMVEMPVDGFGEPRIYLSLLRQVCSNGAIGYSRAFRSDIRIGQDVEHTLARALAQFDHEEGYSALRQRFESAQKSWASIRETLELRRVVARCAYRRLPTPSHAVAELDKLAGNLHAIYGMANLDGLSAKRQRVLPAQCRVYDLINFASELATHRATPDSRFRLQAYIGTLVQEEFDLEGTAEKVPEFNDLFIHMN